jgi:hypothetical protein
MDLLFLIFFLNGVFSSTSEDYTDKSTSSYEGCNDETRKLHLMLVSALGGIHYDLKAYCPRIFYTRNRVQYFDEPMEAHVTETFPLRDSCDNIESIRIFHDSSCSDDRSDTLKYHKGLKKGYRYPYPVLIGINSPLAHKLAKQAASPRFNTGAHANQECTIS